MKIPSGTKLISLKDLPGWFTKGKIYVAGGKYYDEGENSLDYRIGIKVCDGGFESGWVGSNFGLAIPEINEQKFRKLLE